MEHPIYNYSLCIALPLLLFFGFYLLLAKTPDKATFKNYLRSRRIMGTALLLLAANYSVHFFWGIRFTSNHAAILINLSTYFICYWLFSLALITLLDRFYLTWRRFWIHIGLWILYSTLSAIILYLLPAGTIQTAGMFVMATCLVAYGIFLSRQLLKRYHRAVTLFDDTHSNDIGVYIQWMSTFTYCALIFGVSCALLTFLPDRYIFIWILSSIPFYIYLYHCYQNYLMFYEEIENIIENEITPDEGALCEPKSLQPDEGEKSLCYTEIEKNISKWINTNGYLRPGLTLKELADTLHTNRTYLSGYIKITYNISFREWITRLRIEYAKQTMTQHPDRNINEIAEASGFMSSSHFIKTFKEKTGYSPAKWRKRETTDNGI